MHTILARAYVEIRAVSFVDEVTRHERRAMRFLFLIHGDAEAEAGLTATSAAQSSASTCPTRPCFASVAPSSWARR